MPKNDFTRKIKDFETFRKIALECLGRSGQINCCQRLWKVAQSPIKCPIWSHCLLYPIGELCFNVAKFYALMKLVDNICYLVKPFWLKLNEWKSYHDIRTFDYSNANTKTFSNKAFTILASRAKHCTWKVSHSLSRCLEREKLPFSAKRNGVY